MSKYVAESNSHKTSKVQPHLIKLLFQIFQENVISENELWNKLWNENMLLNNCSS